MWCKLTRFISWTPSARLGHYPWLSTIFTLDFLMFHVYNKIAFAVKISKESLSSALKGINRFWGEGLNRYVQQCRLQSKGSFFLFSG